MLSSVLGANEKAQCPRSLTAATIGAHRETLDRLPIECDGVRLVTLEASNPRGVGLSAPWRSGRRSRRSGRVAQHHRQDRVVSGRGTELHPLEVFFYELVCPGGM